MKPYSYDGIIDDYRSTFAKTKNWQPDVFLGNHPGFFKMRSKRKSQLEGDRLAFVDRERFPKLMERLKRDFEIALEKAYSLDGSD